jgi:hypothetical protein
VVVIEVLENLKSYKYSDTHKDANYVTMKLV